MTRPGLHLHRRHQAGTSSRAPWRCAADCSITSLTTRFPPPFANRIRGISMSAKLAHAALAAALLAELATPAAAKTLVYCSEGDPDTLNPQLSESGTAIDAAH